MKTVLINEVFKQPKKFRNLNIAIRAWVVSNRGNKKIRFITISDGSTVEQLQVTIKGNKFNFDELDSIRMGAAIETKGVVKLTPNAKQPLELVAERFKLLKNVDSDFPIQKQEINVETLREFPHLRHRTNLFRSVMLIRSTLAQEIHRYFAEKGFLYFNSPIITSNDGEGAGELFYVNDGNKKNPFFPLNNATLGVTGQLHAESYAIGFNKVYTFAPTFRAEHSNTKKHAAEFWMVEPEVAFYDLKQIIRLADDLLKNVIKNTIAKHPKEFAYLSENIDKNLINRLKSFIKTKLSILDYKDAIFELQKVKTRFENQDIKFGLDLGTEHERYLAEEVIKGPVAIINFPKSFKAFYMHQNNDGETVASFDMLVPGIGELIGGSQREVRYEKLLQRALEVGINQEDLQWYFDLRRFGDAGSSGFGIGFERLVMYVTGVDNIRDVIPYPRTSGNIKM
ncbi:asparagine--tRNA ligase [Mycoplasma tauri]|uniref:Asparagine--tRNA ligase n=1 Tax=Mycoplasma tauri TaxID=547987 RepID=A0A953T7B8_9MOLU|nr:asparagine--tRNA ligase [Mycoplasma tauri]MBZ4195512.1 asparagine--tRNA ligase [Mycoplasma tauri]MBZ4204099.1 asparagine--tRNA ligase [Mycoplasma tauri]MBZ4212497.1 asparagine--tRNA ligase [Mycoplasma tauri]MBZ4218255.1 asparagine--tRNA ligase [Mycoplasma tauri]MBZ4226528.1 asparagine--tRNA ligase [Mycoplasma tauri]